MQASPILRVSLIAGAAVLFIASSGSAQQLDSFLGKNAKQWSQQLSAQKASARRGAAFALGKLGTNALPALEPLINALANDADPTVRESAAFALGEICKVSGSARIHPKLMPTLRTKLTSDAEPLVRRSCAFALGCMGSDAVNALEDLNKTATHKDPGVRQNIAWTLGKIGKSGVLSLQNILNRETDPLVIRDAAGALAKIGPDAAPAVPALVKHCGNNNAEVKKAVLAALVPIVNKKHQGATVAPLRQALNDPILEVRRNAALALANIGGDEAAAALDVLMQVLDQDEMAYRYQAAAVIGNLGEKAQRAIPSLLTALRHKDAKLRRSAALGLGNIGKPATGAVRALVERVTDNSEDTSVREEAAVALKNIGPCDAATRAIPELVGALRNHKNSAALRAYTLWALRVHDVEDLAGQAVLMNALEEIVANEPKNKAKMKMLRYDSAFLLGVCKEDAISDAGMKTLEEFLYDTKVKIYLGTDTSAGGGSVETGVGGADSKKQGQGDGRVIAVSALSFVGAAKVQAYPRIVQQLRDFAANAKDMRLKEQTQKVLKVLGL